MAEKAITLSQFESLAEVASRSSGTADLTDLTSRIEQLEAQHDGIIGIEQLSTGGGFGQWQRYEDENSIMSTIEDLTTKLAEANARIEELEAKHTEVTGIEQLATGGGFGSWKRYEEKSDLQLTVEKLVKATARIEVLEAQHEETTGIEQLATGGGFGSWQRYESKSNLQLTVEDLVSRIEHLENNANS